MALAGVNPIPKIINNDTPAAERQKTYLEGSFELICCRQASYPLTQDSISRVVRQRSISKNLLTFSADFADPMYIFVLLQLPYFLLSLSPIRWRSFCDFPHFRR